MLGLIAGDMIGSIYEMNFNPPADYPLFTPNSSFTDDTVLATAVADVLLNAPPTRQEFAQAFIRHFNAYPHRGYGGAFQAWARAGQIATLSSFGNGCAMRVGPIGWVFDSLEATTKCAAEQSYYTHHHSEGKRGAQAIASAVYLARKGVERPDIRRHIKEVFEYPLDTTPEALYAENKPSSCQASVPLAIRAFLESDGVDGAIRKAISWGGDCDTLAAMAGAIAEAYHKEIPEEIENGVYAVLNKDLAATVKLFYSRYVWERKR